MPMIDADGCLLNVAIEGRDNGPTLMLSNSLGCTMAMWEPQMPQLTKLFRVIRYDRRGHGKSGVPPGPYTMERFGRDVLAILDDLNIEKAHWCGLSMGGMVGQWLGANAADRFDKLILCNTSCHYPDPTNWDNRIKAVRAGGIAAVADAVMPGWLTEDFLKMLQATGGLGGWVSFLETPSDAELAYLYRTCLFTATVSLYEGWGLPIGEGLGYGKTGVVSRTSSMPEVGGDMVEYCDPHSVADIARACLRLLTDPEHRAALETRIATTRLRGWDDVGRDVVAALTEQTLPKR